MTSPAPTHPDLVDVDQAEFSKLFHQLPGSRDLVLKKLFVVCRIVLNKNCPLHADADDLTHHLFHHCLKRIDRYDRSENRAFQYFFAMAFRELRTKLIAERLQAERFLVVGQEEFDEDELDDGLSGSPKLRRKYEEGDGRRRPEVLTPSDKLKAKGAQIRDQDWLKACNRILRNAQGELKHASADQLDMLENVIDTLQEFRLTVTGEYLPMICPNIRFRAKARIPLD
jgi:hypothetical protein